MPGLGLLFSLVGGGAINAAAGILKALIEFFKTPVGQVVGLGLLVIAAYVGGKAVEHHQLTVKHRAEIVALNGAWLGREKDAAAAYETARTSRDADVATQVRGDVDRQLGDRDALIADLKGKLKTDAEAHPNAAGAARVTADLVRRRDGLLARSRK